MLDSFGNELNIVVFGSHGGIGEAMVHQLKENRKVNKIYSYSRRETRFDSNLIIENKVDITNEDSVIEAASRIAAEDKIDIIIIATGLLHDENGMSPEKSLRDVNASNFMNSYLVNAVGPALIAKHFSLKMNRNSKSVFSAISARVSSISDNHLGGWYAYRASKAALNQIIKTTSIEVGRRFKQAVVIGLHPGTVDTDLSEPFKSNVAEGKLFTTKYASECLLKIINDIEPKDSGKLIAWDGEEITY